jgi:hypothetical protein
MQQMLNAEVRGAVAPGDRPDTTRPTGLHTNQTRKWEPIT